MAQPLAIMNGMQSIMIMWVCRISLTLLPYLSMSPSALAMLGESTTTVEQDRTMLQGTASIEAKAGFSVHHLQAAGVTVREYSSPSGIVFGIAWKHQTGPLNLEQLFGAYYGEYGRAVARQPRQSQRYHLIETDHIIVERGGRMGATWGRVWIPSLLPPGLSKDQIQ